MYNDVLLQDVRMDRKEINCVLNEKEKQICSETNVWKKVNTTMYTIVLRMHTKCC